MKSAKKCIYNLSIILFFFFLSINIFSQQYTRLDLIETGRRSLNLLGEYKRLTSLDNLKFGYLEIYGRFYTPYEVDTSTGPDGANVFLGGFNVFLELQKDVIRFYTLGQIFSLKSKNRQYFDLSDDRKVSYGEVIDIYVGVDYNIIKNIKIQIGISVENENLNNSISTGTFSPSGDPLFREIKEAKHTDVIPVLGIYIDNIKYIFIGAFISYSFKEWKIANNEFVFKVKLPFMDIVTGYNFYRFFQNEFAYVFKLSKILNIFGIGTEIFTKNKKMTELFAEARLGLDLFKDKSANTENRQGPMNSGQQQPNTRGSTDNNLRKDITGSRVDELKIQEKFDMALNIKLNLARTPETLVLSNSNRFKFGLKAGFEISYYTIRFEFAYMYNLYNEMIVFRHALNKHGFWLYFNVWL